MTHAPLLLDGSPLSRDDVVSVARGSRAVRLDSAAEDRITAARSVVQSVVAGRKPIYGVNTGFGSLSRERIGEQSLREIQRNLLRSHAAGVGPPLPPDQVRAMMLILTASLARGRSGVRVKLITMLIDVLNAGIIPAIPSLGSVGASGDLAPLAHLGLVLIGEGEVLDGDTACNANAALLEAGIAPLELEAKEGLALVNGTHLMTALGVLALHDAEILLQAAVQSAAMAIDACRASDEFLDDRLHEIRNQPGQRLVASRMRDLLAGSTIRPSHLSDDPRVQDPYSLRATPQVLGAASDAFDMVRSVFDRELGSVTDNPAVFHEDEAILSGGNFHGMPLAIALDHLAIAVCAVSGITERRINWLLSGTDSENPVHPALSPEPGLHSGMMIVQYTAAACCNEIQGLCAPASTANIPTAGGIEDYNSFGPRAGRKALDIVHLAITVVAIELLVMSEALEYQRPLVSGDGVESVHTHIRATVSRLEADRSLSPDIEAIRAMIVRRELMP